MFIIVILVSLYLPVNSFTIFYDLQASWEFDFVCSELFSKVGDYTVELLYREFLTNLTFFKGKKEIVGDNAYIISSQSNLAYDETLSIVKYLQPKVIMFLSDEGGGAAKFNDLRQYTKLYMRQYCHGFDTTKNDTVHLPLGFMKGMYNNNPAYSSTYIDAQVLLNKKREYIWTFVGNQGKHDRPDMLLTFKEHTKPYYLPSSNMDVSSSNITEIYSNALFVPIGKGDMVHDCFRIYEAASCGAIPVIVANTSEIQSEFGCHYPPPPIIFANSWLEASAKVLGLLNNESKLKKRQAHVLKWWRRKVTEHQKGIEKAVLN